MIITRASGAGDYYLMPLPMTPSNKKELDRQIERYLANEVEVEEIKRDKQSQEAKSEGQEQETDKKGEDQPKKDGNPVIAYAFETEMKQEEEFEIVTEDPPKTSEKYSWDERLIVVRSLSYQKAQKESFAKRLDRAEAAPIADPTTRQRKATEKRRRTFAKSGSKNSAKV